MGSKAKTIGDIVELVRGNTYKSALLDQPGPVLLGLASIERNGGFRSDKLRTYGGPSSEKHLVYPGDMYVSLKDITQQAFLLGSIARVPNEINVGRMTQDTVKLLFKDTTYSKELFYWVLRTPQYKEYCKGRALGTTNLSLSRDDFLSYELPEENKKRCEIVNLLENIESKTSLSNKINHTLEQIAQALFKSWFVDFDPVVDNALDTGFFELGLDLPDELLRRAEARKTVRAQEGFKHLPAATRQLFPTAFEPCDEPSLGLGSWVPKGWLPSTVGDEFNITMGQSPSGETYNEEGIGSPFFQGKTDFGFRFPSNRIYCTEPKRMAKKLDTLVSVRAPVGDINLAAEDCVIGRGLAAIRHKSDCASFSYYAMNSLSDRFAVFNGEGTVFGSINQKAFKAITFIDSPRIVISEFSKNTSHIDHLIRNNTDEIISLTKIRDTLLPKLISGELSLGEFDLTTQQGAA